MDQILNYLAGALGVHPSTLVLLLGVFVAVSNLVGKLIPDDATGTLGVVRKLAKVGGLYVSTHITDGVTVNDTAKVVAGLQPKNSLTSNTTARSPAIVGILAVLLGVATVFLAGCTPATLAGVNAAANAVCTSAPIAQALYDSAVATGDQGKVNEVLNKIQAVCPSALVLIHTIPVKVEVPVVIPPPPTPGPERG